MKRLNLLFICLILSFSSLMAQNGVKELQLEEISSGYFKPETIQGIVPMPNSDFYTQMNKERTQIIKYSFQTGEAVEVLFDVNTARDCTFKQFDSYSFSPDGTKMLIATETVPIYRRSYKAVHYLFTIKRNLIEPLSDGGPQQVPVFSPDSYQVAFVRDNNIFLVKLLYNNSESQVTQDGETNKIINGIPDWVYEEEFGFNSAITFSSDSELLAFIKFDESAVKSYSFPLYGGQFPQHKAYNLYPGTYTYKYPKAGEANAKVSVHSFDIKSRVTREIKVPIDEDGYIPRIRFTPQTDQLAIFTLNRHQNKLDLYIANARSTVSKLILRDESPQYIKPEVIDQIVFYPNNFSFLSEKDGYQHLYWYNSKGTLVKQVTQGQFEVKNFLGWDANSNTFYYESNEGNPLQTAIYKIDAKNRKTVLTENKGTNKAIFSTTLSYFINNHSSLKEPTSITLNDNRGRTIKTLVDNNELKLKLAQYNLPTKEFFSFTTRQGTELNGWMIKPTNFSTNKKYPVIQFQYSGPGSQEVVDRWAVGGDRQGIGWESYMASQGFLIVCVDGRGTGGRGADFEKCTYLNLGVKEAEDQVATANYLNTLPYVDSNRIGIWGWSYGGYMTIMSMSALNSPFKAGVAVAPVTDWKYYDTIYGERFMRTPQENFEGYATSSTFSRIENLQGELLLVHGMADDNVHFQNTIEYSESLIQANKSFKMQVYPNRNHGIYGGNTRHHLFTQLTNFFKKNL